MANRGEDVTFTKIMDGFDDGVGVGTTLLGSFSTVTISTANPRTGTRHARCVCGSQAVAWKQYTHSANLTSGLLYGAHYINASGNPFRIIQLWDGATPALHLEVQIGADRIARIYSNNAGIYTLIGTGTFVWPNTTYTQWCLEWTIATGVGGSVKLYINGSPTPDINVSGVDTQNSSSSNAWVNDFRVGVAGVVSGVGHTVDIDDIALQDTNSPDPSYVGDVGVMDFIPNAVGDDSDGTIVGGAATRHESLDEVPADDGTTTVQFSTVGDRLLMNYADIADTTGSIFMLGIVARIRKLSAATRGWTPEVKLSGVSDTDTEYFPTTSWKTDVIGAFPRDPSTNPWTGTNLNAVQAGGELTT